MALAFLFGSIFGCAAASPVTPTSSSHGSVHPIGRLAVLDRSQRLEALPESQPETIVASVDSAAALPGVAAAFTERGLTANANPTLRVVTATGTVKATQSTFGVRMYRWHDPLSGRTFYANDEAAQLPPHVTGVLGLDNYGNAQPAASVADTNGLFCASACYTAKQLRTAYNAEAGMKSGVSGGGETVAIFATGGFAFGDDIGQFDKDNGLAAPSLTVSIPAGGQDFGPNAWKVVPGNDYSPSHDDAEVEAEMDIEAVHGMAPDAAIHVYEAADGSELEIAKFLMAVANDGAQVVSISYVGCEANFSGPVVLSGMLELLASHGVSAFASSGDGGRTCDDYADPSGTEHLTIGANFPASSPWITAVGGTRLELNSDNDTIRSEQAWDEPTQMPKGASGGGTSALFTAMPWQASLGGVGARRVLPDVSAAADPSGGMRVTVYSGSGVSLTTNGGGTSLSAPLWAGFAADYDQAAAAAHVGPLGLATELLYVIAPQPDHPLIDVTSTQHDGGDLAGRAGPGWDFATGLGSPNLAVIIRDGIARSFVDLRRADWSTATVPADACGTPSAVTLHSGRATTASDRFPGWPDVVAFVPTPASEGVGVAYGDLDGNGHDDAAVLVVCDTGGGTGRSILAQNLVIYSGHGGLHPLGVLHTQLAATSGAALFDLSGVALTARRVVAVEHGYGPNDSSAAPSLAQTDTWTWDDTAFHRST